MWPDQEKIPDGWVLCDGSCVNGIWTPDLRDRFPVGVDGDTYQLGWTGGTNEVVLATEELPKHSHMYEVSGNRTFRFTDGTDANSWDEDWWHQEVTGNTSATGGSGGTTQAHENRPPYYAVCFIMRVQ